VDWISARLFLRQGHALEIVDYWALAAPNLVIENIYGSTELTVGCTACRWDNTKSPDECEQGIVPIGQSFDGIQTLIVDEQLREWKDGRDGELLMIGPQLYLVIGRTGKRLDGHLFPSPATTVPTTEREIVSVGLLRANRLFIWGGLIITSKCLATGSN
jgi:AMP-binding enzyme